MRIIYFLYENKIIDFHDEQTFIQIIESLTLILDFDAKRRAEDI